MKLAGQTAKRRRSEWRIQLRGVSLIFIATSGRAIKLMDDRACLSTQYAPPKVVE